MARCPLADRHRFRFHWDWPVVAALLLVIAGCQSPSAGRIKHAMKFGPPPPGYARIRGEAVPDWQPADMHLAPRGAGTALTWTQLGPRPIINEYWSGSDDASGRVVSIAPHPVDPNTCYIASASGGVWKTTDGGLNWIPLTDELATLNHGAVALDPSDPEVVYAGTGEYPLNVTGGGLFRSLDGGQNWERIATTSEVGTTCTKVIVAPDDPLVIHLTGNAGYVRSDDGGMSWTNRLSGPASGLAINPGDPQILYVGRHGDGVYRSLDGGLSWTKLAGGLPSSNIARVLVDVSVSNPNVVYTAMTDDSSNLRGLYRSADGGNSWTLKDNTPNFPFPQGWYDFFLGIDPTNENTVYAGGVFPTYTPAGVVKTTDGGDSWTDITIGALGGQVHPDQHAVAFGPEGTVWVGCDGGVWKSVNGGQSWINTNATLTVTQNYNIALHPTDTNQVMGGTQDNGTVARESSSNAWPQVLSGDGGFLAYDFDTPTRTYMTYVFLTVYRRTMQGMAEITGPWDSDPAAFIAPLVMDPNDAHTLVGGTNRVWRTTDAHTSANWTAISSSTVAGGGVLTALAIGVGASDTIYTGSSTGKIYATTDGSTWDNRTPFAAIGDVADLVLDPSSPSIAYACYNRSFGKRVLWTNDYGQSWNLINGDLPPGVSPRALAMDWRFDPPHLYLGTGVGVYSSSNRGVNWIKDGLDLPNVNIGDLAIDPIRQEITAGTYGRGAWRADLPIPGDLNGSGTLENGDHTAFTDCLSGPGNSAVPELCTQERFNHADFTGDNDVDEEDFAEFVRLITP